MHSTNSIVFLAFVICFLSLIHLTHGETYFNVKGKVYCDTCHVQFITKATTFLQGAKVQLECKNKETNEITIRKEAETDESGEYHIKVKGDHEEELCQVTPISSPDPECNKISQDPFVKNAGQISLSHHKGITSKTRNANPIGFLKETVLPQCSEILSQMGVTAYGLVP